MEIHKPYSVTNITSIKLWNDLKPNINETIHSNILNNTFKIYPSLNKKIALWCGDILYIRSQAIVFPINDMLDTKIAVNTAAISKIAGSKYVEDFINLVLGCKTGEIRLTKAHDLACQYVLHTVCPRYNPKYESAAINALYNCYRNALMTAMEKGIRVIAFAPLHTSKYNFPNSLAIHMATRTIRRFLEKYSDHIDIIVLQITKDLYCEYEEIMPIYFPRNDYEEKFSSENIPVDIGNEDGQPSQPNREIRISAFPYGPKTRHSDSESDSDSCEEIHNQIKRTFSDITSSGKHSLAQTQVAPAVIRQSLTLKTEGGLAATFKHLENNLHNERRFDRLLRTSRKMDMSFWTEKKVFYQCGKDINDRPLLVVIERNIPRDLDIYKNEVFAFIIWTLEKVAKGKEFIIIYAHTQSNYQPSRQFLTEIADLLHSKYYKNLHLLCMIHPTLINRGYNWIFSTFNAPAIKKKMITVTNLRQLYRIVNPSFLEFPDFIYDYDKQVGGNNVYNDSLFLKNQTAEERKLSVTNSSSVDGQL